MGATLLILRLASRDLRRRPVQALLLLLAITAATTVASMGLALHGVTSQPYLRTRTATRGPDVVAQFFGPGAGPHGPGQTDQAQIRAQAAALIHARGVAGHSGPYPVASAVLRAHGLAVAVEAEGRGQAPAAIEQPEVTSGTWVRHGGVVIERTFAQALGVGVGDRVSLDGHPFTVAGIAVTAASPPYPNLCHSPGGGCVYDLPLQSDEIGLAWVTTSDARSLASAAAPLSYLLNLKLRDPAGARRFVSGFAGASQGPGAPYLIPWQDIAAADGLLVQDEQQVLSPGALLAGLLALATVTVLAGARMAERTRRTGLLKAAGGTPGVITAVLLAENLALALTAAGAGLAVGWLAAPLAASPGAALVGAPGAPSLTGRSVAEVVGVALVVALAATLVPAIRAARVSTVAALADQARPPRRRAGLVRASAWLPAPLMLGLRLVARRPRRAALSAASVAVTVAGLVAVLAFHATADLGKYGGSSGLGNPVVDRDEQMLTVITVVVVSLAILNAVCSTWATALDSAHASALTRALGASPRQVGAGLAAAQVIPALPGAVLGVPLGIGLFAVANHAGIVTVPSAAWLIAVVTGTLAAVALLAGVPARISARRPAGEILQAESA